VEGMNAWPVSEKTPLKAPGYVKIPGRPKKERKREAHEKPKSEKASKVGTIIRCTKCMQIGHNRSTCDKRNGQSHNAAQVSREQGGTSSSAPHHSTAASMKRKANTTPCTQNKRTRTTKVWFQNQCNIIANL